MKNAKATKTERRARRKGRERRRDDQPSLRVLGGTMAPEDIGRVMAAMGRFDPGAAWPEVAPLIVPVLKRLHHPFPPEASPIHITVPPGISTGFGIDLGPAFTHVTAALADGWGVDHATLLGTSLENLRRLVVDEPPVVQLMHRDGAEIVAVSGQGWGSSLLLLPEALGPILGTRPRLLLAPIRNTMLALPDDADLETVLTLWAILADGARDELDVAPMRWTGQSVVALGDELSQGLPN
ncbi:MAG: hypothetical protein WEC14_02280 [Chloroflexota bacterium]